MMKNRKLILPMVLAVVVSILAGCGNVQDVALKEDVGPKTIEVADESEPVVAETEVNATAESVEADTSDTNVGGDDFPGLYGYEYESPYEGQEGVMFTDWYYFFPNHKGVYVGEDSVYFSWDDEGVLTYDGGSTEKIEYDDAAGTVVTTETDNEFKTGTVYTRYEGNVILPGNNIGNVDSCDDGIYNAEFFGEDVTGNKDSFEVSFKLFIEDAFDIVDVHCLKVGDAIMYSDVVSEIEEIDEQDGGVVLNRDCPGKVETVLTAQDESNCYTASGFGGDISVSYVGSYTFAVSDNARLTVTEDGTDREMAKDEMFDFLKENYGNKYTTTIRTEAGKVVEIFINSNY